MKINGPALVALPILCLSFAACVPVPSVTLRSPEVSGRVLDAGTGKPMSSVKLALEGRDYSSRSETPLVELGRATSDSSGKFVIGATHNFNVCQIGGICGFVDFPGGRSFRIDALTLMITAPGHEPIEVRVHDHLAPDSRSHGGTDANGQTYPKIMLDDVQLTPLSPE